MSIKQRWWQMRDGSGVMMTMSGLTSVSWHHVTNVTWHQCRARDMCHGLSPVTKLSISSIQMSLRPPARMPQCPLQWAAEWAGWMELKSFEMINITLPHQTDPKNHHLQCALWTRVDKKRSTPNVFISGMNASMNNDKWERIFQVWWHSWHLRWLWTH